MALEEYRRKRDFRKTPEPAGAAPSRKKAAAPLAFVIQEHKARRLHFDFRLELDGVLKSWAVPKGPSLDPGEKRLAVEVEDHPLDYGGFEGVIPEGQYGGGTVLLWDRGTWVPADPDPAAAFAKGMLKFELRGEKLHGNWALVRMGGKAARERRPNWLLIKERDDAALPQSGDAVVADNPLSVETGRSLDMIAQDRDRVWDSQKGEATAARRLDRIPGARKGPMPAGFKPQLATLATAAPVGTEWLHEIKYDGYRLFARIEHGKVRLITRNGLDWTTKFPELAHAFGQLPVDTALIDGELVCLASDGTTSFSDLQDAIASGKTGALNFFAFDLVHHDGWDLTGASLEDRKAALCEIIPPQAAGILRYSDHQVGQGPAVLRQASSLGLEGIVSKRREAPYRPGRGAAGSRSNAAIARKSSSSASPTPKADGRALAPFSPAIMIRREHCGMRVALAPASARRVSPICANGSTLSSSRTLPLCCPRMLRARASVGFGRSSSPRSNSPAGPPTLSSATPPSRGCARTRARKRSSMTPHPQTAGR